MIPASLLPSSCPSLPSSIGALGELVELFITDNRLESLPAEMGQLIKLVKCQVRSSVCCWAMVLSLVQKREMLLVCILHKPGCTANSCAP